MASRMSHTLGITGPSFHVNTACSSSMTAMHLALQAINNGECEGAIVGGCQINTRYVSLTAELDVLITVHSLSDWKVYQDAGILAPDNRCKPFDAGADGFSKGEGASVVVLKPLEAALADNDYIYSVVRLPPFFWLHLTPALGPRLIH